MKPVALRQWRWSFAWITFSTMTFPWICGCEKSDRHQSQIETSPTELEDPSKRQPVATVQNSAEVTSDPQPESLGDLTSQQTDELQPPSRANDATPESDPTIKDSSLGFPHRMLIPTTAGNFLCDVFALVDDRPIDAIHDQTITGWLRDAAGNSGQRATWDEFFDFLEGFSERPDQTPGLNYSTRRQLTERYDGNRNGRVDADEAARYLFRDRISHQPFRVQGTETYRRRNRDRSLLLSSLDGDGNGKLDAKEQKSAPKALLLLDRNFDHRIDVDELPVDENLARSAWRNLTSSRYGRVAMDLNGFINWDEVAYSIDSTSVGPVPGQTETLRKRLDFNEDGIVEPEEAKMLADQDDCRLAVDMQLRIDFFSDKRAPTITVLRMHEAILESQVTTTEQGCVFQFQDLTLSFSVSDASGQARDSESIESELAKIQIRARASEFPDALLAFLDSDWDSALSQRELLTSFEKLATIRTAADIPDAYRIHFARGPINQDDNTFRMTSSQRTNETAGLDDGSLPAWFIAMDINRDGEVSRLEFPGTDEKFRQLDTDRDQFLTATESIQDY